MSTPLLATKLYVPPPRPKVVIRPRLLERLNEGLHCKLSLVSAPAGFGKTTLLSEWIAKCGRPTAWLALDDGDNDPTRFLTYLIAALQSVAEKVGKGVLGLLQSSQPPPVDSVLTTLVNEITTSPHDFVLVLDDYHVIEAEAVDLALTFLLDHMPPQMHLVIATREDPALPLARLRVRNELSELRASDLRFTLAETTDFLNQVMGLNLSEEDVAALEARTEGWVAGLQLAALSMRGHQGDATSFIQAFTGSHHFVLDYLVEEVLHQQPEDVQTFLLHTSILNRLCGSLCDALLPNPAMSGQTILEYLERANLFLVPLDNERNWYRYHHLFGDLLRQRLHQSVSKSNDIAELHIQASAWYEANGLDIEAFHHAIAANDVACAERLIEGDGMPLHFRGALAPVLNWLASLPMNVLDTYPSLWTTYASVLLATGQPTMVPQKLAAAEAALQGAELTDKNRDLIGRVAAIRATLAANQRQVETIITQSRVALEYLHPDNQAFRTFTIWKLGYAYQLQGDRVAARQAYSQAITDSQASGNTITTILATTGLASVQETDNQLDLAMQNYQRALQLIADMPLPVACEAHLGLARIFYEWNDLDAAQECIQQAQHVENHNRFISCAVLLARVKLAQDDVEGAAAHIAEATHYVRQHDFNFVHRMPELAAAQVLTYLRQSNLAAALHLAQTHNLTLSQARTYLAQGDSAAALVLLEPLRQEMEAKGWADERLRVMVLQVVAYLAHGEREQAICLLQDALTLAEPGGLIRIFVDERLPMAQLLSEVKTHRLWPHYVEKLLAAFDVEAKQNDESLLPLALPIQELPEPLSQRELEVLQLVAQGFSNHEIGKRLFLALNTVKGHNRNIFGKLQVQRRTEAIARARDIGLL